MAEAGTVHVVDDDESLRGAVGNLLRSVGYAVELYESPAAFTDTYRAGDGAACLLLDVRLRGANGLEFHEKLDGLGVRLPVIMMTGHGDIPMSVRAMKAGAVDFLSKPFRDQDLLEAVMTALARSTERNEAEKALAELKDRFQTLSPREREVMALVTDGKLNKQMAGDLNLSEITVKIHRSAAMRKMGARTLPDLVKMSEALRLGEII